MEKQHILLKRLTYIKQLFKIGIRQSKQHESISTFSILAFHDSIEMFLKLLAEHKNIKSDKLSFIEYWNKIPDLTLRESMRNLNARRVNIKHKGLLPAKSEIEISRVNTQDFFNQNTISQFGIHFEELSLIELVTFSKVKRYLNKSVLALETEKFELSIQNVAYAFEELVTAYESNKSIFWESPYNFGKKMRHRGSSLGFSSADRESTSNRNLSDFIDETVKSITALQKATKILSLGFDYKESASHSLYPC